MVQRKIGILLSVLALQLMMIPCSAQTSILRAALCQGYAADLSTKTFSDEKEGAWLWNVASPGENENTNSGVTAKSDSDQVPSQTPAITVREIGESDPESYLHDLDKKERKAQNWDGAAFLILGGLQFWIATDNPGSSHSNSSAFGGSSSSSDTGYMLGSLDCAIALYEFCSPTPAKRKLNKLAKLSDESQRKEAGYKALKSLRNRALASRIVEGIVCGVAAGVFIGAQPIKESGMKTERVYGSQTVITNDHVSSSVNYVIGVVAAVGAMVSFAVPSQEEKAYKDFLQEIGRDKKSPLQLGVGFSKHRQLWVAYSF